MDVYSDFTIPAFGCHVTIYIYIYIYIYIHVIAMRHPADALDGRRAETSFAVTHPTRAVDITNNARKRLMDKRGLRVKRHDISSRVGWVTAQFDTALILMIEMERSPKRRS
jgi:hypothetical protein